MNKQMKIIEALVEKDCIHEARRPDDFKVKKTVVVQAPDYNVIFGYFNDNNKTIEISLRYIDSGNEYCRHVFESMEAYNAFIGQMLAPPDELFEGTNQNPKSNIVIEHKLARGS